MGEELARRGICENAIQSGRGKESFGEGPCASDEGNVQELWRGNLPHYRTAFLLEGRVRNKYLRVEMLRFVLQRRRVRLLRQDSQ